MKVTNVKELLLELQKILIVKEYALYFCYIGSVMMLYWLYGGRSQKQQFAVLYRNSNCSKL